MAGSADHSATARQQRLLGRLDQRRPDSLLELEDQPGADGPDNVRSAALLASDRIRQVAVLTRVHERDRAAPGNSWHPVGDQITTYREHSGSAGPTDEFVRREENRVLMGATRCGDGDVHVRGSCGEVPEGQGSVGVQQPGHAPGVGDDPGHVARRRKRSCDRRAPGEFP